MIKILNRVKFLTSVFDIVKMIIISALVGGLIGIEREKKETVLAGSRTFMLIAIFGTFSVLIAELFNSPGFISASFIGVSLVAVLLGYIKNYKLGDIGITTTVVFLIAFALGLLVAKGMIIESLAASVIVSGILVSKYYLHSFTRDLTHQELVNALEFGVIAFVLYPIVPDAPIDPFGVLNPRILVLLVIVVSTMGLFGFISLRRLGPRKGFPIVGAMGSLVNSEAVASSLSAIAKKDIRLTNPVIEGIMLANIVMLLRNLVIAGVLSLKILNFMILPQLSMVLIGLLYFRFRPIKEQDFEIKELSLSSPFAIVPALKFALLFLTLSLIVRYIQVLGVGGVYFAVIIGSFLSSAAVIASLVSMHSIGSLDLLTAASACVVASIASLFAKILIARVSGSLALAKKSAIPIMIIALIGEIMLIIQGIA
jgi:uncharacterized membrane protein (DUF4010 family)